MNQMNKLNKLLQDLKDAELYYQQMQGRLNKGMFDSVPDVSQAWADLQQARAAFEQEKTNLMNTR